MVLFGINCGFGNTDIASLPQTAVNLKTGWVEFPRPKTEINRRVPLWPETLEALKTAIAMRPKPLTEEGKQLCFLSVDGWPLIRVYAKNKKTDDTPEDESKEPEKTFVTIDSISSDFKKLLRKLNINGRKGLGFYTLRHCFETEAGESKDQVTVDSIMGHVDNSMGANYRHRISDERLKAVVDTVHSWLFGTPQSPEKKGDAS